MDSIGNLSVSVTESLPAQGNEFLVNEGSLTENNEKSTALNDVTSKYTDSFPCHICGKYFAHGSSLYRHKKSVHPQLQSGSICCQETKCSFSCRTLQDFRRHLKCFHDLCMEEECKTFDSIEGTVHICYMSTYVCMYIHIINML